MTIPETATVKIAFGLEQQGHIPTIEAMLSEGADWHEIGRSICWDGETARQYYERYLARSGKATESAMTIPEHIREEAEACYLHCEQMDSYGIIETIATALLAAEQRGMERAAEIADSMMNDFGCIAGTEASDLLMVCADLAAAIRKAREERG